MVWKKVRHYEKEIWRTIKRFWRIHNLELKIKEITLSFEWNLICVNHLLKLICYSLDTVFSTEQTFGLYDVEEIFIDSYRRIRDKLS